MKKLLFMILSIYSMRTYQIKCSDEKKEEFTEISKRCEANTRVISIMDKLFNTLVVPWYFKYVHFLCSGDKRSINCYFLNKTYNRHYSTLGELSNNGNVALEVAEKLIDVHAICTIGESFEDCSFEKDFIKYKIFSHQLSCFQNTICLSRTHDGDPIAMLKIKKGEEDFFYGQGYLWYQEFVKILNSSELNSLISILSLRMCDLVDSDAHRKLMSALNIKVYRALAASEKLIAEKSASEFSQFFDVINFMINFVDRAFNEHLSLRTV